MCGGKRCLFSTGCVCAYCTIMVLESSFRNAKQCYKKIIIMIRVQFWIFRSSGENPIRWSPTTGFGPINLPTRGQLRKGRDHSPMRSPDVISWSWVSFSLPSSCRLVFFVVLRARHCLIVTCHNLATHAVDAYVSVWACVLSEGMPLDKVKLSQYNFLDSDLSPYSPALSFPPRYRCIYIY